MWLAGINSGSSVRNGRRRRKRLVLQRTSSRVRQTRWRLLEKDSESLTGLALTSHFEFARVILGKQVGWPWNERQRAGAL